MTDISQSEPSGSSRPSPLSFAMGQLTERVTAQGEQVTGLRGDLQGMPERIVALILPRIVALETTSQTHDTRLAALERDRWKVMGGGVVILFIGSIVFGHHL